MGLQRVDTTERLTSTRRKEQCLENPSHHRKMSKIRQTNLSATHHSLTFTEGLEMVHASYWFCAVKQRLVRPNPCPLGDLKMMIKCTYVNNQNKHVNAIIEPWSKFCRTQRKNRQLFPGFNKGSQRRWHLVLKSEEKFFRGKRVGSISNKKSLLYKALRCVS